MINLRDYQDTAVGKIRAVFRKLISAVLLVIPTGGGKTVIFTYIAQRSALKGKKSMILVHRVELLRQTSAALDKFDVSHGMVNPMYTPSFDTNVQVASVQTIVGRLNYFASASWVPDILIVDEAHHATAGSWRKVIDFFKVLNPDIKVLGVTATPIRTDGQGLGTEHNGMFDELVIGPTTKWLMDEGFLCRAKVLSPPKKFDSSQLKRRGKDYNARDIESLINKPTITGDVVSHYESVCKSQPTIVFCATVKHAEEVAEEFRAHGYKFYALDGNTDDDVRKRMLAGLADGSVDGVTSCDLISEGTDVPAATCAILLRLTSSLSLHLQQIGRVLRPVYAKGFDLSTRQGRLAAIAASEKPYAYVLDHVGNVGNIIDGEFIPNHGTPEQEHEWSLDGEIKGKRKKKTEEEPVKIMQCMSCFAVHEPSPVCPECGHVYQVKDRRPKNAEGELQEITPEMAAEIAEKKRRAKMEEGMATTIDDFRRIAAERGWSEKYMYTRYGIKKKQIKEREEKRAAKQETKPNEKILTPAEINVHSMFNHSLDF